MKQFTTKQQTDRLIELGYPKPNSIKSAKMGFFMGTKIPCIEKEFAYSIGELVELLPKIISDEIWWGKDKGEEGIWGLRIDTAGTEYGWDISYERDDSAYLYREGRSELIDALYDMMVNLKERK